ncbi:MAG: tetratricopeptide repeat protein [Anaerolineae bacterium]|nr:tetratricopeptide repeat protein [Anaerolineae bacterium]
MATPLLTTKLYIPPVRPGWVPRPRLIARLDAGLYRRLTLISAPAGSGKTTLASGWLARLRSTTGDDEPASRGVAWLSLDSGDSDPARFFTYLVAALDTVDASLAQGIRPLLKVPHLPPIPSLVTTLINDLAAHGAPLVVALDDYHAVDDLGIHEALGLLVEHLPPTVHLVVITRHDPPLPLSRLRARGQVTEIRQRDLAFSTEEAARFLNESMGLGLAPTDIALLESRTEGWITGLQLAALSMQGRDPASRAEFVSGFSGRYHLFLDYLTDEVLSRQPEEIQRFLLWTSILDRMCAPLCDALLEGWKVGKLEGWKTGLPTCQSSNVLAHLDHANIFLMPLDDEHRWYRYHALFADLLRARLHEVEPEQVPVLHHRAAAWFEQEGFGVEAVNHALAGQDDELAAGVIERTITRVSTWSHADITMIRRWLQALPDGVIRSKPWLWLFTSRTLYVSGQPETASRELGELESWLHNHPEVPEVERLTRLVTVDRASYAVVLGEVREARDLVRQALAAAPDADPIARFRTPAILGMAALRAGDVVEAEHEFSIALDIALDAGLSFAAMPFACNLAETLIVQGRLREAMRTCQEAMNLSTARGESIFVGGFVGLEQAKILYEWNDLQAAGQHLIEGLDLLTRGGIPASFGSIYAVLAQVRQAQGDADGALRAVRQAVEGAQRDGIPRLQILTSAYQARIWLAQGRYDLTSAWARDYRQVGKTEYLREFEELTLARLLLAGGRPAEALALAEAMLPAAVEAGRGGSVIDLHALRALACHALNRRDAALAALAQALALAEPEGYVRLFVDLGGPMAALLKGAGSRGLAPRYVGQLLAAFASGSVATVAAEDQPLVEPLSERELEVLVLLAQGLSNAEIGRRLFISLPTVKSHTGSIYGKLGVHARAQAVARARELGMLPPE